MSDAREELSRRIAGEITLSDDPGATLRKWRTDFDVSQTELADQLDVSSSVVSDYESGRRESPGRRRPADGRWALGHRRATRRRAAPTVRARPLCRVRERHRPRPPRVLDGSPPKSSTRRWARRRSCAASRTTSTATPSSTRSRRSPVSSEEFYRLYGQSTNRALVFTNVTRGESPLVALRVVSPTPNAVVLHGIEDGDLWDHAADLARVDGFSLAISTRDLDD